jgi:hypothetical protein
MFGVLFGALVLAGVRNGRKLMAIRPRAMHMRIENV